MQNTPRAALMQFSQLCQMTLFPMLEQATGELSSQAKLLAESLALLELARFNQKQWLGRPRDDRNALVAAFLAKSIYNLSTTRQLLGRLRTDAQLRSLCGWLSVKAIPSESTFSRAFADFARRRLPERMHESLVRQTQHGRLVGHIARDSTAIEARENFPEAPSHKAKKKRKPGRPKGKHARMKAKDRGPITKRQLKMSLEEMMAGLPRECSIGVKTNSKGHTHYWKGYKLHLDVADGQIPITAILTGANVHDACAAVPLMTLTTQRIQYLYDVMDSAYDANSILRRSQELGHVPIVKPHGRRNNGRAQGEKIRLEMDWAKQDRFAERTMVERVNGRLKDEFGGRTLRVRGPVKAMAHLMFGVIALTVDQLLKLTK